MQGVFLLLSLNVSDGMRAVLTLSIWEKKTLFALFLHSKLSLPDGMGICSW